MPLSYMQTPFLWDLEYDVGYGACIEFWDKKEQITVFEENHVINTVSCCAGRIIHSLMLKWPTNVFSNTRHSDLITEPTGSSAFFQALPFLVYYYLCVLKANTLFFFFLKLNASMNRAKYNLLNQYKYTRDMLIILTFLFLWLKSSFYLAYFCWLCKIRRELSNHLYFHSS